MTDQHQLIELLKALKQIIEVSQHRGAFQASEMLGIGQVYNSLLSELDLREKDQVQYKQSEQAQVE